MERPANASMLNAGRGNPNFLATIPRHGFWQLGLFAMRESERSFAYMPEGVGGFPKREGLTERFDLFLRENKGVAGIDFLRGAMSYVRDQLGYSAGDFLYEMCEGILASNYPVPDRMLKLSELIVGQYLRREMIGDHPFVGEFDVFAVEGGTAAMTYIFNTMRENHLIKPGDTIALGMPIFTPYIEIPRLNDYQLNVVNLERRRRQRLAVFEEGTRQAARSESEGVLPREPEQSALGEDQRRKPSVHCRHRQGTA